MTLMELMEEIRLDSTNIYSVSYDPRREILIVRFRNNTRYRYFDVPESVFQDLLDAESHGKFFHKNIRNVFVFEKMGD